MKEFFDTGIKDITHAFKELQFLIDDLNHQNDLLVADLVNQEQYIMALEDSLRTWKRVADMFRAAIFADDMGLGGGMTEDSIAKYKFESKNFILGDDDNAQD